MCSILIFTGLFDCVISQMIKIDEYSMKEHKIYYNLLSYFLSVVTLLTMQCRFFYILIICFCVHMDFENTHFRACVYSAFQHEKGAIDGCRSQFIKSYLLRSKNGHLTLQKLFEVFGTRYSILLVLCEQLSGYPH